MLLLPKQSRSMVFALDEMATRRWLHILNITGDAPQKGLRAVVDTMISGARVIRSILAYLAEVRPHRGGRTVAGLTPHRRPSPPNSKSKGRVQNHPLSPTYDIAEVQIGAVNLTCPMAKLTGERRQSTVHAC